MSFNVKKIHYPHKTEYIFYSKPIDTEISSFEQIPKKGYWEKQNINGDSVYINSNTGEIREEQDITHCQEVSRKRSLNVITQLAHANDWDWFYTLTFNPDIIDSFNYDECYKAVYTFFNNLRKRKAPDIKYLVVPELHKSGRYHFHALVANSGSLEYEPSNKPYVYNIKGFKYGFTTATKVKDTKRVSSYITKYITKEIGCVSDGRHRYLASRNLNRPAEETLYLSITELEELKLKTLEESEYFKNVEIPVSGNKITYVHVGK